jgi:hypothetical protein
MIFHTMSDKIAYLFLSPLSCIFIVSGDVGFYKIQLTCLPEGLSF